MRAAAARIVEQFNSLEMHDDRLRDVVVPYAESPEAQNVVLKLERDSGVRRILVFRACRYMRCELDLVGKALCDDAVAAAYCAVESEWRQELIEMFRVAPAYQGIGANADELLHFRIEMIPPGGAIDILAEGFEFQGEPDSRDGSRQKEDSPSA